MSFHDVFGSDTLPPAELGFLELTITTDTTLLWPYNTNDAAVAIAKITDISCASGNSVTLPDATEVSVGEDFLFRNVGAEDLTVKDAGGNAIATVATGAASYFYLTDNTTAAGQFGVIGFGVGTSSVDAGSLVGYGIKAIGASLNQAHPVVPTASGILVDGDSRAKLIVFTGGADTMTFVAAATLGDDFFTMFRNEGTGTLTLVPNGVETIDGQLAVQVQPGESLMLVCTGTEWFSVGYGRSVLYQFTQLTKDVSAAGTITLTAAEASNKLITFIGNPAAAVTVVIPAIVAVYYTYSNISTAQTIIFKTAVGAGVGIDQNARIIALCDGTNVLSAQSAVANSTVSLTDGNVASPSLFFATQTNTGLYKQGTANIGFSVLGVNVGTFTAVGLLQANIGANTTQRHSVPAVASDTVALLAATQSFTNKTFAGPTNVVVNSASAALTITQTGAGKVLEVLDAAGDATPFVIDANGNVVVGHTTALVTTNTGQIQSIVTGANAFNATRFSAGSFGPELNIAKSASGSVGTNAIVSSGMSLGSFSWSGADGQNYVRGAQIECVVDDTPDLNNMPGRLVFSTSPVGSGSPVERMRIDSNGNVGIGKPPESRLDITATDNVITNYPLWIENAAMNYGTGYGAYGMSNRNIGGVATNVPYTFDIGDAAIFKTNDAERMRIASNGLVTLEVGSGLSISRTAVTAPAVSDGNIFTGSYTPTLGNILNTSARTAYAMSYSRSGNTVTGVGSVSITATAIGRCVVTMSVPVASDFTDVNARDAGGAVLAKSTSSPLRDGGHVRSNPLANTLEIDIYAGSTSATEYAITYQYKVLP